MLFEERRRACCSTARSVGGRAPDPGHRGGVARVGAGEENRQRCGMSLPVSSTAGGPRGEENRTRFYDAAVRRSPYASCAADPRNFVPCLLRLGGAGVGAEA